MGRKKKHPSIRKKKKKKKQPSMGRKKKKTQPVVVMGPKEIEARHNRCVAKYNEILRKYEGFDLLGAAAPGYYSGLMAYICDDENNPCCDLVLLYAKLGLHRYNLLEGKNVQLNRVRRYNRSRGTVVRSYYITLEANDPANDPATLQTFQARVNERKFRSFVLTCTVARVRGHIRTQEQEQEQQEVIGETGKSSITGGSFHNNPLLFMPDLPSENPFEDNSNGFYVLKDSELQDNHYWIRLYVELAVATTHRGLKAPPLTNLKILKVAMESTPYLSQGVLAHEATFYIRYEDSCQARVGKDVDRVAIVRRVLDWKSFSVVGRNESSNTIIPSVAMEAGSS